MDKILDGDLQTFGDLCTEMNHTLQEGQGKLQGIQEQVEKLSKDSNYQYIDVKSILLLNYVMSLQYYMLYKAEGRDLNQHPIFERLAYLRLMIEKLKPLDKKIDYQVEKLLRSSLTQNQGEAVIPTRLKNEDNLRYKPNLNNFDTKHITEKAGDVNENGSVEDLSDKDQSSDIDPDNINSDDIDSDELEKYTVQKQKDLVKKERQKEIDNQYEEPEMYKAVKFNPVKMHDTSSKSMKQKERDQKRMTRVDLVRELKRDMLNLPEEVNYGIASGNKRLIEEEREDEELEMKYFKRIGYSKKELKERAKRHTKFQKSDFSGITDGFHDFERINEFMNKDYSGGEEDEANKQAEKQKYLDEVRGRKRTKKVNFKQDEIDSDLAGDDKIFKKFPKQFSNKNVGRDDNFSNKRGGKGDRFSNKSSGRDDKFSNKNNKNRGRKRGRN